LETRNPKAIEASMNGWLVNTCTREFGGLENRNNVNQENRGLIGRVGEFARTRIEGKLQYFLQKLINVSSTAI
jgi:hypothetical protein